MSSGRSMAAGPPPISANGRAPRCSHLDGLPAVTPQSQGCRDCAAAGAAGDAAPATLLVCLTCGWVACSDDSPNQHAKAHYAETDHPLARSLETGSHRTWCYVHRRLV